jgi:hypothetical protein
VILSKRFGEQDWILQAMSAVQEAVQNCIENLSGSAGPQGNAMPLGHGGQYAHPARTAAQIKATPAAQTGESARFSVAQLATEQQSQQALADGNLDMFAKLQKSGGYADPVTQPQPQPQPQESNDADGNGWIL